ncbi:MAG: 2-oxo-3-(phosphooxy)propyl 3-oxoalkanoate synthase [Actinomycetota bacterium]|jgi:hypothetical protein|nr:2-oxo-3-(phosphooxy)propyl 3-oxoalkanoate synthase [Actinomycetota bacterium]
MNTTGVADRARQWSAYTPDKLGVNTTATVDRHLAHKKSSDDVVINDVARHQDMLIAVGTLPTAHRYFNDTAAPGYDALHLAEFMRQGVEVIAHTLLEVPLTNQFVIRTVHLQLTDPATTPTSGTAVIAFSAHQVRRNGSGAPYSAKGPVHCLIDGRHIARCDGLVGFLAPETYRALRDDNGQTRAAAPAGSVVANPPHTVGRQLPENVFIGQVQGHPREARCLLVPRPHPTFFDRPLDHYPGMMIADAARQLAILSFAENTGAAIDRIRTTSAALDFVSFAELDVPPTLQIVSWGAADSGADITVESRQGSRVTATCTFRVSAEQLDRRT